MFKFEKKILLDKIFTSQAKWVNWLLFYNYKYKLNSSYKKGTNTKKYRFRMFAKL